jgi:taurine dioxygenase
VRKIETCPLHASLSFGARIQGVTHANLEDESIREHIRDVFERRGVIVFEDVEPSERMHLALSSVFGPLKPHPVPAVARVDEDTMPGVIDMRHEPDEGGITEVDGKPLSQWLPWHFDHCYNNELNRAGVLRAIHIPPEGGLTLFADGIALYEAISPELRARLDGVNVLYSLNLSLVEMRFGRRAAVRYLRIPPGQAAIQEQARQQPRAVHPAVWTRATGEKVLHVSPWGAVGLEGRETPEGDALLEEACQAINIFSEGATYSHAWKPTDMLIWDNWRMLHAVSGMDPIHPRRMQRTTIQGDYGLGYFEGGARGGAVLQMAV